jgi:hypothetical protein
VARAPSFAIDVERLSPKSAKLSRKMEGALKDSVWLTTAEGTVEEVDDIKINRKFTRNFNIFDYELPKN